jgi:N-acetylglutamate synthase-like GNAT family acetyltransferase
MKEKAHPMKIIEHQDYDKLMDVFVRNGLEAPSPDDPATEIKHWALVEDSHIVGGSSVSRRNGSLVLDYFAIDGPYRKKGWSRPMLEKVMAYAIHQGDREIYTVTKIPDYFKKTGFRKIDRKDAPDFSQCFSCPQYQKDCFPEVMVKRF